MEMAIKLISILLITVLISSCSKSSNQDRQTGQSISTNEVAKSVKERPPGEEWLKINKAIEKDSYYEYFINTKSVEDLGEGMYKYSFKVIVSDKNTNNYTETLFVTYRMDTSHNKVLCINEIKKLIVMAIKQ